MRDDTGDCGGDRIEAGRSICCLRRRRRVNSNSWSRLRDHIGVGERSRSGAGARAHDARMTLPPYNRFDVGRRRSRMLWPSRFERSTGADDQRFPASKKVSNSPGRIVVVGCDPSVLGCLRSVRHGADVTVVTGVDIDSATAGILGRASEVIVDVGIVGRYGLQAYDAVRSAAPQASLVLYVRNVPRLVHRSLELVRQGTDGTWVCGLTDHPTELRRMLDDALVRKRARVAAGAAAEASGVGSEAIWSRLLVALPNVFAHADLSHALEMSPMQLRRMVQSSRVRTTRRLLMWARLIAAQRLFEETEMSIEAVAHFLNYSSASALHNVCQRLTTSSPRDLGRHGGLDVVLCALRTRPSGGQLAAPEALIDETA